jgi:isocitrate lyase
MTSALSKLAEKFKMTHVDEEEQLYLQDVEAVKKWWTDSRWRYTKRRMHHELLWDKVVVD